MAVDHIIRGGSRDHTIGEVKGMGKEEEREGRRERKKEQGRKEEWVREEERGGGIEKDVERKKEGEKSRAR